MPDRDTTTRYLCGAAHLDADFANAAIAEHLVEWTRAVTPSAGVDAATVLREAVAARTRRRIRDGILLALLTLAVIASPGLAVSWFAVAAVTYVVTRAVRPEWRGLVAIALAVGMVALLTPVAYSALLLVRLGGLEYLSPSIWAFLPGLLIIGVLVGDEVSVDQLTRQRFRPRAFEPDAYRLDAGWERTMRTLGHRAFGRQLDRVAWADRRSGEVDGMAGVVVHREWSPFVGAGPAVRDQAIALPLEPEEEEGRAAEPQPFTAAELHAHVAAAMKALGESPSLSPGRRLAGLRPREVVLIPAESYVREDLRASIPALAGDLGEAPEAHLPLPVARHLADVPLEPARYYQCFRIDAWDRELTVSCYFTAATDQQTLYLEWTQCVLPQVAERYRAIDRPSVGDPISRGLLAAVLLPVSVPARLASLVHRFRPIRQRPGEVVPARYGAGPSLRELAADAAFRNFFLEADAARYLKLLEQTMLRAVGGFLEDRGYSVTDVLEAVRTKITNSLTIQDGDFRNSAIGIGSINQTNHGDRAAPASATARKRATR